VISQYREPFVDLVYHPSNGGVFGEGLWVDFGGDVTMLSGRIRDFLVEFLGDLDEASAVDLAKPLEVSHLVSQLEESPHQFFHLVIVQIGNDFCTSAIPVLKKFQASMGFGKFLVVEGIDIFKITVQGEEKLYRVGLGDTHDLGKSPRRIAHLLSPPFRPLLR
jgi:hypothetical protein